MKLVVVPLLLLLTGGQAAFLPGSSLDIYKALLGSNVDRSQCRTSSPAYFPCSYRRRSNPPPTSVNRLQPGDISIVAALGDSVIGSSGASSPTWLQAREEYRGVSFAIGALQTWRTITTIPNILREFSPRLVGGSVNIGGAEGEGSNLNLASPGATSVTLIEQAEKLVKILNNRKDRRRWKLVTILIGHNDVCTHTCNNSWTAFDASPPQYGSRVGRALDMLRDYLPRTFVNLVPLIDITFTLDMKDKPPFCRLAHPWVCPCLFPDLGFGGTPLDKTGMQRLQKDYMEQLYRLVGTGRYEKKDFTVVIQPAFSNIELFKKKDKRNRQVTDYSFFAPDCLHPSQKLHGIMARALWNNMLSPIGRKSTSWSRSLPFLCPTPSSPYLATRANSGSSIPQNMKTDYAHYMTEVRNRNSTCYL